MEPPHNPIISANEVFKSFSVAGGAVSSETRISVLRQFCNEMEQYNLGVSKYNIVTDYLKLSGNCSELTDLFGNNCSEITSAEMLELFATLEGILLSISQENHAFENTGKNIVTAILQFGMRQIMLLLSMQKKSNAIKRALKLLTAMVTQGTASARDVQLGFHFHREGLTKLLNLRNSRDSQDVRVCFVRFIVSFLVTGDNAVIQKLLEQRGFLNSVFPGLVDDKASVIILFLTAMKDKVLHNAEIRKSQKLWVFNDSTLRHVFELFSWKGPRRRIGLKKRRYEKKNDNVAAIVDEAAEEDVNLVHNVAYEFLHSACCSYKFGIIFRDLSLGYSGKNMNRCITKLLSNLQQPYANTLLSELIVEVLKACPDQVYLFFHHLRESLEPRRSLAWFQAMDLINKIIISQTPLKIILMSDETRTQKQFLQLFFRLICPVFKGDEIEKYLEGCVLDVRYELVNHVGVILEVVFQTVNALENSQPGDFTSPDEITGIIAALQEATIKVVPGLKSMFECLSKMQGVKLELEKIHGLAVVERADHILKVLDVVTLLKNVLPTAFVDIDDPYAIFLGVVKQNSTFLTSAQSEGILLKALKTLSFSEFRSAFATISKKETFEDMPVYLLLKIFVSATNTDSQREVRKMLKSILLGTMLFDDPENELSIWLHYLRTLKGDESHGAFQIFCLALSNLVSTPNLYIEMLNQCYSETLDNLKQDDTVGKTKDVSGFLTNSNFTSNRRSFLSPLLPAALSSLSEIEEKYKAGAATYVSRVAREILHHQYEPEVVSQLLGRYTEIFPSSLVKYLEVWRSPSQFAAKSFTVDKEAKCETDSLSLQLERVFLSLRSTGKLSATFPNSFDSICQMGCDQIIFLVHQLLLYVQTEVNKLQDKKEVEIVTDLLAILDSLLQQVDSSKEVVLEIDFYGRLLKIVLTHPLFDKWFLLQYQESVRFKKLARLLTAFACKYLCVAIERMCDIQQIATPYKKKAISVIRNSVFIKWSSEQWDEMRTLFETLGSYLQEDELLEVVERVLLVVPELFQMDNFELACKFLNEQLSKLCLLPRMLELKVESVQTLATLVSDFEKDETDLASHLFFILESHPLYCFSLDSKIISSLLKHTSTVKVKLVLQLVESSTAHLQALHLWLEENSNILAEWPDRLVVDLARCSALLRSSSLSPTVYDIFFRSLSSLLLESDGNELESCGIEQLFEMLLEGNLIDVKSVRKLAKKCLHQSQRNGFLSSIPILAVIVKLYKYLNGKLSDTKSSGLLQLLLFGLSKLIGDKNEINETCLLDIVFEISSVVEIAEEKTVQCAFSELSWSSFVRFCLKYSLQCGFAGSSLLSLVCDLAVKMYSIKGHAVVPPVSELYDLLFGHSNFVPILMGELGSTDVKEAIIDLMTTLTHLDPSLCKSEHFPVLLGAYQPTFMCHDQKLLYLMKRYEDNNANMHQFRPFLWGPHAVSHYAVKKGGTQALWKHPGVDSVLGLLDGDRLQRTALLFPLNLKLEVLEDTETNVSSDIYDPRFLLPLFAHLLAPGNLVPCKRFLESKCLGVIFASLASNEATMRSLGYYLLSQFYQHLEGSLYRERFIWLCLLDSVKNAVQVKNQCLSTLITLFLVRLAHLLFNPQDPLYVPLYHFLTLKPSLDLLNVPEFYKLFYSSDLQHRQHREWILKLIGQGVRKSLDFHVCQKRYIFNIILTFYLSPICTHQCKLLILECLKSVSKIAGSACTLCKEHGLLAWMRAAITEETDLDILELIVSVMDVLWESSFTERKEQTDEKPFSGDKHPFYSSFPVDFTLVLLALLHKIPNQPQICIGQYLNLLQKCLAYLEKVDGQRTLLASTYVESLLRMRSLETRMDGACEGVAKILVHWRPEVRKETLGAEECRCLLLPTMETVLRHRCSLEGPRVRSWLTEWLRRDRDFVLLEMVQEEWTLWTSILTLLASGDSAAGYVSVIMDATLALGEKKVAGRAKRVRRLLRSRTYADILSNQRFSEILKNLREAEEAPTEDLQLVSTFLVEIWMGKKDPDLSRLLMGT